MKTLALLSLCSFASAALLACSGGDAGPATEPGAGTPMTAAAGGATDAALAAACSGYFDALAARKERCGPAPDVLNVDAFEAARESGIARCVQQGSANGTGYTPAFYATCSDTLATAACDDDDALVRACWEPRGTLVKGMGCSTDDQCADGFCKLPEGASKGNVACGTCDVPIWVKSGHACFDPDLSVNILKCLPGLTCWDGCNPARPRSYELGESCTENRTDPCGAGLGCSKGECVAAPVAKVGESCRGRGCEVGTSCRSVKSGEPICKSLATLGEACDPASGYASECVSWLECSATHRCELPETMTCK